MIEDLNLVECVPEQLAGMRLDQILSELFPHYSRARLQRWNKKGWIRVNGDLLPGKRRLAGGEKVVMCVKVDNSVDELKAEPIALNIVYQDEEILVINKPAGLVMHPGAGNWSGTVQNGLLHLDASLAQVPRAGIVHRLDKDTTGLFVVARTLRAHKSLVEQLQEHRVARNYLAIVNRVLISGGTVNLPIGRHSRDRKRMAVQESGKVAVTHYRLAEKFRMHTLLSVQLETGRTHQIRVHMAHINHPLLGDRTYGGRPKFPPKCTQTLRDQISDFRRQALHARRLTLQHPTTGEQLSWQVDLPDDMQSMLTLLREDNQQYV